MHSVDGLLPREIERSRPLFEMQGPGPLKTEVLERVQKHLVEPVRTISDRGGKGWHSTIMLLVSEALGANAKELKPFVGVLELLHVGSLLVDDVQDGSTLRRGGPPCHELYGDALAINAGNTAYFLLDEMIEKLDWAADRKLSLYRLFFQTMRCAHAGQALDIAGLRPLLEKALATRHYGGILDQVSQTYRLKTGMFVALCMATGALHAGLKGQGYRNLLSFGEVLGEAFQIGDDVLKLNGLAGQLGEFKDEFAHGNFSFPMALALETLSPEKSAQLARLMIDQNHAPQDAEKVLNLLQSVDAVHASKQYARKRVNQAWLELEPYLIDNQATQQLFELSERFIERHY